MCLYCYFVIVLKYIFLSMFHFLTYFTYYMYCCFVSTFSVLFLIIPGEHEDKFDLKIKAKVLMGVLKIHHLIICRYIFN